MQDSGNKDDRKCWEAKQRRQPKYWQQKEVSTATKQREKGKMQNYWSHGHPGVH